MRGHFLVIAILLSLSRISVSHFFFPNVTIPPELLPNITKTAWDSFNNLTGCHSGDKTDGLSKLKKYFQDFGYIDNNSSSSNFTDDFDDALERAIKTYQRNFKLNVTGELDDATLKQIVRPRCGNADVINGTSSMNSGESPSSSKTHFNTVGHYTFFPDTPRWPENKYSLTYAFHPDNQLSDTVKAVFTRAFARWSEVIPLTFTMTESYTNADIRIAFFSGDHGDGEPFDGVLGTLAHAFSPTSGRFHLDAAESWVVDGDVTTSSLSNAIDLESVAIHEIGHLLGLGHSSVEEAIMYPTISAGTRKVALATDDVDGVQYLYGSNPNYNGSTATTSIQETTPGSGVNGLRPALWGLRLLVAIGFVLMLV